MEGPLLPEESEGEEPSAAAREADDWALLAYERRLWDFERTLEILGRVQRPRKRRNFGDYRTKNCEEAIGEGRPWRP